MDRSTVVLSARAGLFLSPHTTHKPTTANASPSCVDVGIDRAPPPTPHRGTLARAPWPGVARRRHRPLRVASSSLSCLERRVLREARRVLTLPAPRLLDLDYPTTTFGLDGGVRLPHLAEDVLLGVLPLASEQVSASTSEVEDDAVAHLLRHSRLLDARALLAIWSRHTRRESMRACAAQRM